MYPNDYYYDPFCHDLDPREYEFISISRSDKKYKMYKAKLEKKMIKVFLNSKSRKLIEINGPAKDDIIYIHFGNEDMDIFKDKTELKAYEKNEKLTKEQKLNYYKNMKHKILYKYSEAYFIYNFLIN